MRVPARLLSIVFFIIYLAVSLKNYSPLFSEVKMIIGNFILKKFLHTLRYVFLHLAHTLPGYAVIAPISCRVIGLSEKILRSNISFSLLVTFFS